MCACHWGRRPWHNRRPLRATHPCGQDTTTTRDECVVSQGSTRSKRHALATPELTAIGVQLTPGAVNARLPCLSRAIGFHTVVDFIVAKCFSQLSNAALPNDFINSPPSIHLAHLRLALHPPSSLHATSQPSVRFVAARYKVAPTSLRLKLV